MKEATGDLNMTVVVVLIVAALVAFFSMAVWPMVKNGIKSEANCSDAICLKGDCDKSAGTCNCTYKYTDSLTGRSAEKTIVCPYKG